MMPLRGLSTAGALPSEAVVALPGSTAAAVVWRAQGSLNVTVIVKATFAFAPGEEMKRVAPQEIVRTDVHHGKNPARSARFTSDLAPCLARADVVFTGHAHAPAGRAPTSMPVRLAVFDGGGERALLDRSLTVVDPAGITRIPLVYERALGGIGHASNPLGVGMAPGSDAACGDQPNVLDPRDPTRPGCFAPLGRAWLARKRLLGSTPRSVIDAEIASIPDGFDWTYYQAAPEEQRIGFLRGDEWILLEGLHPRLARVWTGLPSVRGCARVEGLGRYGVSDGVPLALTLDTLRVDGEEETCTVVFRGRFVVPCEDALAAVRVTAGVEAAGEALAWNDGAVQSPPAPAVRLQEGDGTQHLADEDILFDHPLFESVTLAGDEPAAARRPALPFAPGNAAARLPRPAPPAQQLSTGTLAVAFDEAPSRPVVPFNAGAHASNGHTPPAPAPALPAPEPPVPAKAPRQVVVSPSEPDAPPPAAPAARPPAAKRALPLGPPGASPALKQGLYGKLGGIDA